MQNRIDMIANELNLEGSKNDRRSKYYTYRRTAVNRVISYFDKHNINMRGQKVRAQIRYFFYALDIPLINGRALDMQLVELYLSATHIECMPPDYEFMLSSEWRQLRKLVFSMYQNKCMKCGDDNCILHIDHIKPRSKYPELQADLDNLQILCGYCNISKGNREEIDYRPKKSRPTFKDQTAQTQHEYLIN